MTIAEMINTNEIVIVSGEGITGTAELYTGARTMRAIRGRLTRERCGGDRWARARVAASDGSWVDISDGSVNHAP